MALQSFPICLYREAMHLQCFPPMHYVMGRATRAHIRDDLYQIRYKLVHGKPACIVWLYIVVCQV